MRETAPVIEDVRTRAVLAPLAHPIRTASGTIPSAPLVLIDVIAERGVTGHAYIFGYSPVTLRPLVALIENLKEMVVGKTAAPVERMADFTAAFRLLGRQGLMGMAISGLDMALWDALGRANDLPVCALLGGEARAIPAYDSYGAVDPAKDAGRLEDSLARGFKTIKIKTGSGGLQDDMENVAAVRERIGAETSLMIDYNQSLTVPEAVRRIDRLAEHDLLWVEEPVPAEDLEGHAKVRAASPVAIQTGENWWFPEDAARAILAEASDFAMLDLMKIGGITGWQRAAGMAEGASLPVSSHLFVEASAHVLAVTPTAHFLEYLDIAGAVLREPAMVEDGMVRPRGPGLGIEWNERAVERYAL
ncbi:MAG: mandelate racemase [Rhodospirillaceae bacterium]|jgi:mandelate racemase|nr:mandelate racemase [Rhodospirillaceae bacterium]MBT6117492.1 mandelate racemase [Rhodospirillaceae bacterium]